jgi:hypothetical protein
VKAILKIGGDNVAKVKGKQKTSSAESLPAYYREVLSLIGEGSDNPTTVSTITKLTGLKDTAVRQIVHDLRVTHKKPIGTSNVIGKSGYYIITNDTERDQTAANMRSRASKIMQVARAIESIPDKEQTSFKL